MLYAMMCSRVHMVSMNHHLHWWCMQTHSTARRTMPEDHKWCGHTDSFHNYWFWHEHTLSALQQHWSSLFCSGGWSLSRQRWLTVSHHLPWVTGGSSATWQCWTELVVLKRQYKITLHCLPKCCLRWDRLCLVPWDRQHPVKLGYMKDKHHSCRNCESFRQKATQDFQVIGRHSSIHGSL